VPKSDTYFKKGQVANPKGRTPGPTMPTLLLKEAFLRAANTAGGGGDDGLHDYLVGVAKTHPQVFVPALSKIIPFQVDVNAAKITVEVIRRFEPLPLTIEHKKTNGHAINGNGKPPASE
jgi:hypothetical protein